MQLSPLTVSYSVRLNNIILPLDVFTFSKLLVTSGFSTVKVGETTTEGLVAVRGDIARKGNTIVRLDQAKMVIGVDGTRKQEVLDVFKEVSAILSKVGVELSENARFYELLANYMVEADKSPMASIQNFFSPLKLEQFDKIMESKSTLSTVKIVPRDTEIDSEDYYDIVVEPLIPRPHKAYALSVVYRSKDGKKTETFTSLLDAKIESIIKAIEKSNPEDVYVKAVK